MFFSGMDVNFVKLAAIAGDAAVAAAALRPQTRAWAHGRSGSAAR
jgi:hypothetical protein